MSNYIIIDFPYRQAHINKSLYILFEFLHEKYDLNKNSLLAAATFLDIRLRAFDKVSETVENDLIKIAGEKIRKLADSKSLNNIDFNTIG